MDFKTIEEIDIQLVKKTDKLIGEINEDMSKINTLNARIEKLKKEEETFDNFKKHFSLLKQKNTVLKKITSLRLEYQILYEPIAKNKAIESIGKWFRDQINLYYVKKLSHYELSLSDLNHEFTVKAIQINCLSGYVVNEKEIRLSTCYLISNDIAKEELITISKHMEQEKNNIDKVIDLIWK